MSDVQHVDPAEARRFLEIYLRDHYAGSTAGLSLVRRCRASNEGTPLGSLMAELETEIGADRRTLEALMGRLDVTPSGVKSAIGAMTELVARLKANGLFARSSPLSRVVELEALAAGIITKRNLWRALRGLAGRDGMFEADELDALIERATEQFDRVLGAHAAASAAAFSPAAATTAGRA
jgi:hypothetical protein